MTISGSKVTIITKRSSFQRSLWCMKILQMGKPTIFVSVFKVKVSSPLPWICNGGMLLLPSGHIAYDLERLLFCVEDKPYHSNKGVLNLVFRAFPSERGWSEVYVKKNINSKRCHFCSASFPGHPISKGKALETRLISVLMWCFLQTNYIARPMPRLVSLAALIPNPRSLDMRVPIFSKHFPYFRIICWYNQFRCEFIHSCGSIWRQFCWKWI